VPHSASPLEEGQLLAAIDLGSNSFHLIVARLEHGELKPIDARGEKVQLAAGLVNRKLSQEAIGRGLECLARFSQVLQRVEPRRLRVVGTSALRQAKNREAFTTAAENLLGVPVDVIYGKEEARLIYLGVAHTFADDSSARLVVDIGGGSTEFIVGTKFEPSQLESLPLGCVSYTKQFFTDNRVTKTHFNRAYEAALLAVSHIRATFHKGYWQECVGSSGTLQAIETILQMAGWSAQGITRPGLEQLKRALLEFPDTDTIDLPGLSAKRRSVITAGVAITCAIFDELGIEIMQTSKGALREGVIYDLMGRLSHEDVRERTISAVVQRYSKDPDEALNTGTLAGQLATNVARAWEFDDSDIDLLSWAGRCHAIGVSISQKHFNRHGAYILLHSDLPGFSQREQEWLALLVRHQKSKIADEHLGNINPKYRLHLCRMIALMRLTLILKYAEIKADGERQIVDAQGKILTLTLGDDWLAQHPLTAWELDAEKSRLLKIGIKLRY
jgi:exopolyphosphatase/guanosine-5'-triphosphate,3'-diphosphate pyrophosphatase